MPPPATFQVEKWMDTHETTAKHNLAETCCASISITQLLSMSSMPLEASTLLDTSTAQTYGDIRGSKALRGNLASLYSAKAPAPMSDENILITPGAIAANFLAFYALIGEGDGVVVQYPTYQQLYEVPKSMGAEVRLWKPRRLDGSGWEWDIEDLKALVGEGKGTKMIVLNNPNNPTGAILPRPLLWNIVDLAREKDILVHSDEVYRPIFHSISPMSEDFPPSILSIPYDKTICVGSLSKAYSLAGIRVGWIASRSAEVVEKVAAVRHYTTISVSQIDQQIAALATSQLCLHALLARNIALAKTNLALLDAFIRAYRRECDYVKPVAGTTAFVQFRRDGKAVDDVAFCERLQEETGVMLLPGSRGFGDDQEFKGFVRFGFVCETETLKHGLDGLRAFMSSGSWKDIPLVG